MTSKDFFLALEDLEREKGLDKEVFLNALQNALSFACKKHYGEARNVEVRIVPEKYSVRIFAYKVVVEEVNDPDKEISLDDARAIKQSYRLGDRVNEEITPKDFGRIAAQTAKQVVMQTLRDAERNISYSQYVDKENELLLGVVSRIKEDGTIFVEIGKNQMEGILLPADQTPGEKFEVGDIVKGEVKKLLPFGAILAIDPELQGLLHISELTEKRGVAVKDLVNIGDVMNVKIIGIDTDKKKISLSVLAIQKDEEEQEVRNYLDNQDKEEENN